VQVVPAALGAALFYALFAMLPSLETDRAFSSASISSSSKRCSSARSASLTRFSAARGGSSAGGAVVSEQLPY